MRQFVVPQFIDVESKIIGPITTRQFLILIITSFFIFVSYKLADFTLFLFFAVIFFSIGVIFAFVKINGQPFHYFLLNIIQTSKKPRLRIWYKQVTNEEANIRMKEKPKERQIAFVPKKIMGSSHLSDLSLVVNTGGAYKGED